MRPRTRRSLPQGGRWRKRAASTDARAFPRASAGRKLGSVSEGPKNPERSAKQRRLSAALRENLKRRKAQARGRSATTSDGSPSPHDSAGIADDKPRR